MLFRSISDTLKDKDWVREIYQGIEKDAKSIADLTRLADIAAVKLADKEWAGNLVAAAEKKCAGLADFGTVAGAALKLGDKDTAWRLYETAEEGCNSQKDYALLFGMVQNQVEDTTMVSSLVLRAGQKLGAFEDAIFLAETAMGQLKDKDLALRFYNDAEGMADTNSQRSCLGGSLNSVLKDSDWASRVLYQMA